MCLRVKQIKKAIYSQQPLLLFVHKDIYLSYMGNDITLPNGVLSLLEEYKDVFPSGLPSDMPNDLSALLVKLNITLTSILELSSQTNLPIGVTLKRPRSSKDK